MHRLFDVWCLVITRLEDRLNHPEWREWPDAPGTRWGPLCHWVCDLADWLTGGRCHD